VWGIEVAADALSLAPETRRRWVRSWRIQLVARHSRPVDILVDAGLAHRRTWVVRQIGSQAPMQLGPKLKRIRIETSVVWVLWVGVEAQAQDRSAFGTHLEPSTGNPGMLDELVPDPIHADGSEPFQSWEARQARKQLEHFHGAEREVVKGFGERLDFVQEFPSSIIIPAGAGKSDFATLHLKENPVELLEPPLGLNGKSGVPLGQTRFVHDPVVRAE
jgi:hypothetical protein